MLSSIFDPLSKLFAIPLEWFYELVHSYGVAIMMLTIVVMLVLTPLNLKSTKGMLEMQLLQPEMKKLQQQHKGDRQRLNEEMMKLYQEHKVNPLASCLPLLAQMPVFIGMFRLLRGLTQMGTDGTFEPKYIGKHSALYEALDPKSEMISFGLDLAKRPVTVMGENFGKGLIYALLIVLLGFLYWYQQRMVANRTVNPTMSATQAKLMQYLPVAFAPFQLFFPTGLVIYYLAQTVLRILQQAYITRRFYHGENALGHKAQQASAAAREQAKADKSDKGADKPQPKSTQQKPSSGRPQGSSRVTPPKSAQRPAPSRPQRSTGNQQSGNSTRHPKPKGKP